MTFVKFRVALLAAILQGSVTQARTSTSAAIRLNMSKYTSTQRSEDASSVLYVDNTTYEPCLCNLTTLTCDAFCCCDTDCAFNTRAAWAEAKQCSNADYGSGANGQSLSDCITRKEIYEYNRKKGLTNYIDPFAQLFCVRFNFSPKMGNYWADKTELSNVEIQELTNDEDKSGFLEPFFGDATETASSDFQRYYNLGEKMRSEICDTNDPPVCTSQYGDAFPIPHANIYGMCNNYSSAAFMESETNDCTQILDLVTECESTLNPEFYTTRVQVIGGTRVSSDKLPITVSEVYKLTQDASNPNLIKYVAASSPTGPTVLDASTSTISCSNVLKEIAYTVTVSEQPPTDGISTTAYLQVDSVSALVVLDDQPVVQELDATTGKAMASVQQRFSIKFVKKGTEDQPSLGKSGNPGYIDGLPLLVGQPDASGAIIIQEDGFKLRGSDSTGKCIPSTNDDLSDMGDPTLRFKVDLSYGCTLQYSYSELQTACEASTSPIADLEIFKNLEQIEQYGRFGNAYIYFPKDWELINTLSSFNNLGLSQWSQNFWNCEIYASVHYKIVYAEMGFSENFQKYIVEVQKSAHPVDWTFNRMTDSDSDKQSFEVGVSFQFVKLEQSDLEGDVAETRESWYDVTDDIFYAFATKSAAMESLTVVSTLLAALLTLTITL